MAMEMVLMTSGTNVLIC
uniref:Uncharacterized protein n=1 Tax=Arundo donax TaxID=35708 RepID=A0A0A9BIN9_ARUDO